MGIRRIISSIIKILVVVCSLGGILICILLERENNENIFRLLLFYTGQSNLWIGLTMLFILLFGRSKNELLLNLAYTLKFIFTVCITVTFFVYCFLLAPFADSTYQTWSLSSIMLHVLSPLFAVLDFFVDLHPKRYRSFYVPLSVLPAILYVGISAILGTLGVDYGRGQNYPYYFMNYWSEVGVFGYGGNFPYFFGSGYWIFMLTLFMLTLGSIFVALHPNSKKHSSKI